MKNKILYGYIRESKEDSGGYSLELQKRVGEKVKERFGFKEFVVLDEGSGVSGSSEPWERGKGKLLLEKIENEEIKHLYVYEWSRLSRSNYPSEYLRKVFKEKEIKIYEGNCNEPKNLNDPIDELTSSILSSIYTYERQNMIKRIKDGLIQSRTELKWGGVYLPYGYTKDENKRVTLDDREIPIYLKMIDFVFEGKSIRWIVNWLNENSIPTKSSTVLKKGYKKYKNKDGVTTSEVSTNIMLWRDIVVRNILTNTYYKGVRIDKYGNEFKFPKVIDVEKWNHLQNTIKENYSRNRTGNKQIHNYLLKNIIFCNRDKHKLLGRIKTDERTYYCGKKRKEIRLKNEPPCSLPSPNLDKIESFIWDKLTSILMNSHLIKEEFKKQQLQNHSYKNSKENIVKRKETIEKKVQDIKLKKEKILNLYLDENIDESTYNKHYYKLKESESSLREELIDKNNNLLILGDKGIWVDWVENFSKEVKTWDSEMEFDKKREKILKYIKKVVIDYDNNSRKYIIDLHLKYPMINDRLKRNINDGKKNGYKIKRGKEKVRYKTNLTTYQTSVTSLIVW